MASVSMTESLTCGRVSNKSDGQWNIKLLILRAIALFFFLLIHTNIKRWNGISATSFFLFSFSSLIKLIRKKALIPLNLTMEGLAKKKVKIRWNQHHGDGRLNVFDDYRVGSMSPLSRICYLEDRVAPESLQMWLQALHTQSHCNNLNYTLYPEWNWSITEGIIKESQEKHRRKIVTLNYMKNYTKSKWKINSYSMPKNTSISEMRVISPDFCRQHEDASLLLLAHHEIFLAGFVCLFV